jgi:hypothetical protein
MGAKVAVLSEEARSAVALWRNIDGDGSASATGAGQTDSSSWGSCLGFLLAGRSGGAQGNRRGVTRRLRCVGTEEKREGEEERGRLGCATQRRRGGERWGSGRREARGARGGGLAEAPTQARWMRAL